MKLIPTTADLQSWLPQGETFDTPDKVQALLEHIAFKATERAARIISEACPESADTINALYSDMLRREGKKVSSTEHPTWGYELWEHLNLAHGLILLESELYDIVCVVERILKAEGRLV